MPRRNPAPLDQDADAADAAAGTSLGSNLTRETFQEHWRTIKTLKRELDEANGRYRAARKGAENAGVDLKTLGLLEHLAKLDDGEADDRLNKVFRYAGWLSLPIGTQISLFEAEPTKPDAEDAHRQWAASEAGVESGKHGANRDDNPYPPGSPMHVQWDAGWLNGQSIIAHEMAPTGRKRASTSRARRNPPAAGGAVLVSADAAHAAGHA